MDKVVLRPEPDGTFALSIKGPAGGSWTVRLTRDGVAALKTECTRALIASATGLRQAASARREREVLAADTRAGQIDALARTIYGEARGESYGGKMAVGCVIRNRVRFDLWDDKKPDWWGEGYYAVCRKPFQFSCWNADDPNFEAAVNAGPRDPVFAECLGIAEALIDDRLADTTVGSTHYHTANTRPAWAVGRVPVKIIGGHFFYNDVEKGVRT